MGYTDITVRVCIDVLGPLHIISGPAVIASTYLVWDKWAKETP